MRAKLGGELNSQVSESADTNDINAATRPDNVPDHWCKYSQASAKERCCLGAGDLVRNLVDIGVWPYGVARERALVGVRLRLVMARFVFAIVVALFEASFALDTATLDITGIYNIITRLVYCQRWRHVAAESPVTETEVLAGLALQVAQAS